MLLLETIEIQRFHLKGFVLLRFKQVPWTVMYLCHGMIEIFDADRNKMYTRSPFRLSYKYLEI